jgi:3-oxoacyl-[acyl-carrier protein] reductase
MSQSPTADATSADAQGAPVSRVVLVTGGNRGIGRTIAQEMLAAGHRVAVTSRNGDAPEGTLAVSADVTDADSLDAAFATVEEEYGPVEIVVANAGITADNLLMRMSDDEFSSVIDTNLGGAYRTARRAITNMIRAKHGRIVLISSVSGLYGVAGQANYSSSKAGLVGLARSITREVGSRGITANVVAPGFIRTDMTDELPEKQQKEYLQTIPAKRFAEPEEVAKVVRWIASDEAAYISGAVIPVDGGLGMGH